MFFSLKQQNKNRIPVRGKSKKKNPNRRKSEKTELRIRKRRNPKMIKLPPMPSHFQAAKSPTNIISRENVNRSSLLVASVEPGKVSPKARRITTKIKSTLNKWARKRIVETKVCSEKLKDLIFSSLIVIKRIVHLDASTSSTHRMLSASTDN